MTFSIGENVGPYRITDRLGQGGMASVYRAYHANLDRYVALKVLHAAFKADPTFLARFRREAQIVAKLEHPNIIPIYDYDEHNGEPYLVMKFVEGETLKGRQSRQPLTLDETLTIMTAIGQALTYAHEQGVLHRDIKPSNILLDNASQTYIADFGLARMASAGESTLSKDMMLGTPQYMSPEQAVGAEELDSGTDIYSLGVVLYELVVGRVPFNADTPYAIVHDHIYSPLPLPSKVNPQVPRAVEQVLLKTLSKERRDRYPSAISMVEAFRQAVRESNLKELSAHSYRVPIPGDAATYTPPFAATPQPVVPAPVRDTAVPTKNHARQHRNRWGLTAAALIILVLAALFVIRYVINNPARRTTPTRAATQVVALLPTGTTAPEATGGPDTTADTSVSMSGQVSVAEAQQRVDDNPNDPIAHFMLAAALSREGKPLKAEQEFAEGLRLAKDNPALLFQVARGMAQAGSGPQNQALALVFAYAYAAGASTDATLRNVSGQYLYNYVRNGRRRDVALYKKMEEPAADKQSAGLYALLSLAYSAAGQPDSMRDMMDQATKLGDDLPEVHLVRGILIGRSRPLESRKQFAAASSAPDAPSWVAEEARRLAQQ
jgi:serine/threonine protein kinase/Tfp pilus assembly protein PilF